MLGLGHELHLVELHARDSLHVVVGRLVITGVNSHMPHISKVKNSWDERTSEKCNHSSKSLIAQ